jgi:hypothetical protein
MPAGSGPQINQVTAFAMPADTVEHVVCTIPPSNWSASVLGNLLTFAVLITGAATGNVTLRVRQGTAITGTQVGSSLVVGTASAQVNAVGLEFQDASAFATGGQQGGQYVLTAQGSVNSVATLTSALLELETIAPVQ